MPIRMASSTPHHEGRAKVFDDKKVNGKEVRFEPRDLNIVWGKDQRYWKVPEEGANEQPAELLQVSWLEVTGSANNTNPEKDYEVIFNISLTPDAFGWASCPIYVMVKRGKKGKFTTMKHHLANSPVSNRFSISCRLAKASRQESKELYFGLYEVWSGKWKGGLQIHDVIVKEVSGN